MEALKGNGEPLMNEESVLKRVNDALNGDGRCEMVMRCLKKR